MKRSLGLWNGIAIIVGVIVGSGIFVSPKGVLYNTGSVGASLVVWCLSGLLALLGALCMAELGTSISLSGGEYTYINMAYGPMASYLYIWVLVLIIMPCSNAISALTFANYCLQPLFEANTRPPEEAIRLLALAILMLLIYINCTSLESSISIQNSFALAKVLALGSIISYGLYYILTGNPFKSLEVVNAAPNTGDDLEPFASPSAPPNSFSSSSYVQTFVVSANTTGSNQQRQDIALEGWWTGTHASLPHLARAFYSGFFTYSGWNSLNAVTEEIKSPHKMMPRAIIISITSVTLIYVLANAAYFAVLTKEEILASDAIAVLFGERAFDLLRWLMPLIVAMSAVGGLNASIFAASRICFAAAREGQLFNALAMINTKQLTPVPSLIFLGVTSVAYLATTRIDSLIDYMTFIEASFAAIGVSTLLTLRIRLPDLERPLKVPLVVPLIYLAFTAALLVLPLWTDPWEALIGVCIALTGLPAYYLTAKWEVKPRFYQRTIDRFNAIVQKLTFCVMPERNDELERQIQ